MTFAVVLPVVTVTVTCKQAKGIRQSFGTQESVVAPANPNLHLFSDRVYMRVFDKGIFVSSVSCGQNRLRGKRASFVFVWNKTSSRFPNVFVIFKVVAKRYLASEDQVGSVRRPLQIASGMPHEGVCSKKVRKWRRFSQLSSTAVAMGNFSSHPSLNDQNYLNLRHFRTFIG